jgi:pyrimidine-nucleoside phosphorylase
MSKKMAEGIDALVLDVKTGNGAFMKTQPESEYLAKLMVETGVRMGKKVVALITGMDEPLGRKIGNALEVEECIEVLRGEGPPDLRELCLDLSAWMLLLAGRVKSLDDGKSLAAEMIASGRARDTFRDVIRLQGGDPGVVDDTSRLPRARHSTTVAAQKSGFLRAVQCEQVGIASMLLGGGREKKEDAVDPAVGLVLAKKVGDKVQAGESLCTVHYNSEAKLPAALELLSRCFEIGDAPPKSVPLVRKVIGG